MQKLAVSDTLGRGQAKTGGALHNRPIKRGLLAKDDISAEGGQTRQVQTSGGQQITTFLTRILG